MVLFYISCIVFSTKCYILCMYTLQMIFQCSNIAYSIFALLCHPRNGFVNIKLAYIIAIKGWILTSTIFWLVIWLNGTFLFFLRNIGIQLTPEIPLRVRRIFRRYTIRSAVNHLQNLGFFLLKRQHFFIQIFQVLFQ